MSRKKVEMSKKKVEMNKKAEAFMYGPKPLCMGRSLYMGPKPLYRRPLVLRVKVFSQFVADQDVLVVVVVNALIA